MDHIHVTISKCFLTFLLSYYLLKIKQRTKKLEMAGIISLRYYYGQEKVKNARGSNSRLILSIKRSIKFHGVASRRRISRVRYVHLLPIPLA